MGHIVIWLNGGSCGGGSQWLTLTYWVNCSCGGSTALVVVVRWFGGSVGRGSCGGSCGGS